MFRHIKFTNILIVRLVWPMPAHTHTLTHNTDLLKHFPSRCNYVGFSHASIIWQCEMIGCTTCSGTQSHTHTLTRMQTRKDKAPKFPWCCCSYSCWYCFCRWCQLLAYGLLSLSHRCSLALCESKTEFIVAIVAVVVRINPGKLGIVLLTTFDNGVDVDVNVHCWCVVYVGRCELSKDTGCVNI